MKTPISEVCKKAIQLIIHYRFGVLLAIVVLYLAFGLKKSSPPQQENGHGADAAESAQEIKDASNSISTSPRSIVIYHSRTEEADPKLGLPAEMSSEEFKSFA